MLNTDIALGFSAANAENSASKVGYIGQKCGPKGFSATSYGCSNGGGIAIGANSSTPITYNLVSEYSTNLTSFLINFANSFAKMTSVGYGLPANIDGNFVLI